MQTKGFHVTYCSNVHPGEDWEETFNNLAKYIPSVKDSVCKYEPFGLGLRLSNKASLELSQDENLKNFKAWLDKNQLYVFTMNGFPYGDFHHQRVKDLVHAPDWSTKERLDYTLRLFEQLHFLLPNGISGGISTSPISYKHWFSSNEEKKNAQKSGAENLLKVAKYLHEVEEKTGVYMHLDIEPEPDGLLENSGEVVHFFEDYLLPIGFKFFEDESYTPSEIKRLIKRYLTICYDVCHFSLAYEEPKKTIQKFKQHDVKIGKIQVSSALKILFDGSEDDQKWKSLSTFDEPVYLHQVTKKMDGQVITYPDLDVVLNDKSPVEELRAHFHVPIFVEKFEGLYSTQDQILKLLKIEELHKICQHLEVETYTWDVLPRGLKTDLSISISREMDWLLNRL